MFRLHATNKAVLGAVFAATIAIVPALLVTAPAHADPTRLKGAEDGKAPSAEASTRQRVAGQTAFCIGGYDYATDEVGLNLAGKAVNSIKVKKPCTGAVIGRFVTEAFGSVYGSVTGAQIVAVCKGKGGFAGGCKKGTKVIGKPTTKAGFQYLSSQDAPFVSSNIVQGIFPDLPPGVWVFTAIAAGNFGSKVGYRSFTVDAYTGG